MAFDALLWVAHMSYFHGVANKGIGPELFHPLVLVRDLLVLAVCAVVILEIYRPHLDRVRMTHQGTPEGPDPLAGVLSDPGERPATRPASRAPGAARAAGATGAARPAGAGAPGSPAAPLAFRATPSDSGGPPPTDPETKDPIR